MKGSCGTWRTPQSVSYDAVRTQQARARPGSVFYPLRYEGVGRVEGGGGISFPAQAEILKMRGMPAPQLAPALLLSEHIHEFLRDICLLLLIHKRHHSWGK